MTDAEKLAYIYATAAEVRRLRQDGAHWLDIADAVDALMKVIDETREAT